MCRPPLLGTHYSGTVWAFNSVWWGYSEKLTYLSIHPLIEFNRDSGSRYHRGGRPSKGRFLCFNTSCHPMDNASTRAQLLEHFLSFFMPEGILDFFELVWVESQSLDSRERMTDQSRFI